MFLEPKKLIEVIRHAPLVAIDLVIRNPAGEVLLGLRSNRPAQGAWFVPGGRIYKNERIEEAIVRVAEEELGLAVDPVEARLLGAFDHIYEDNFAGEPGIGTHYVNLGYEIRLNALPSALPHEQHEKYKWFSEDDLLSSPEVHENTKAYFLGDRS